ncbi:MAG: XRE family transcriptional regulator [Flavobacteriales bacterium]|nr:MAG: XRE family transcriptional regulator [Flavobacteriales bacterium]
MEKDIEIYKRIGANVRLIRKTAGLTQKDLATKCIVDRSKISDIENGKEDFMFSTLLAIAKGLGVDVLDFFKPVEEPDSGIQKV